MTLGGTARSSDSFPYKSQCAVDLQYHRCGIKTIIVGISDDMLDDCVGGGCSIELWWWLEFSAAR